jgi:hypothetical protein
MVVLIQPLALLFLLSRRQGTDKSYYRNNLSYSLFRPSLDMVIDGTTDTALAITVTTGSTDFSPRIVSIFVSTLSHWVAQATSYRAQG